MFWVLVLVLFILWCGHRNKRQKAQDRRESIRTYGVPYIADPTRYPVFPVVSIHHGHQEWKAGIESDNLFLHESYSDIITAYPNYPVSYPFDPGTVTTFAFAGSRPNLEQSAFVQNLIHFGNWTINAGLRWDHYQLLLNQNAVSPRVAVAHYFPKASLMVHASYDRIFQTPSFENILLSSST